MLTKTVFLFICLLMLPITGFTLGLGNITVFSKLNEPLKVHIELLNSKSTRLDNIIVKNASLNTYRRANLPNSDTFNEVRFKIKKQADGLIIAELTTKHPVREPFITFIADLKWRTGHINREYTFLLDPPEFIQKQIHPGSLPKKEIKTQKNALTKKTSAEKASIRTPRKIDYSTIIANHIDSKTYTSKHADTLWEIARKVKPSKNVTTYQTMQALFALNPKAFIKNNINLLKQGQTLKIPTQNEIRQINGKPLLKKLSIQTDKSTPSSKSALAKTIAKKGALESKAQLKIIPPPEVLLNTPVTSKKDLILINKALQNSISTINSLKNDNDQLSEQINALTKKLNSLDSHNQSLNDKISKINIQLNNQQNPPANSTRQPTNQVSIQEPGNSQSVNNINPTQTSDDHRLEVDSNLTPTDKAKSLVHELLTSPVITIILAIFTFIILVATLFTIRSQNEKRKLRKQNAYIPFPNNDRVKSSRSYSSKSTQNNSDNINNNKTDTSAPASSSLQETDINNEKTEDDMDFFEYFEKKINAPEAASDANSSSSQPPMPITPPETKVDSEINETSEITFALDNTDEIKAYEESVTKPKPANTTLSEIDTYLAYGNYNEAERRLISELQKAPSDKNLHLKLFECYAYLNKRYEFIQHADNNVNLLNVDMLLRHRIENLFQETWDEPLGINNFN